MRLRGRSPAPARGPPSRVFLPSIPLAFWSTDGAKYFWLVLAVLSPLLGAGRAPRARRRQG